MRKLIALLMILALVLCFGCAKKVEAPPEPVEPAPSPVMGEIGPEEAEEIITPPEPEEEEPETIGTRITVTEPEIPPEEEVPEEIQEIKLFSNKTMSISELTIPAGTTLAWKNYDVGWPHVIVVESGSGYDTVRHAESPRLLDGQVWENTFDDPGTYKVRDIFSGKMWMTLTVE